LLLSVLAADEPFQARLASARAREEIEGGSIHVEIALLSLLAGERHEAEMALLRARCDANAAAPCLTEIAWAFLLVETGQHSRVGAHAERARLAEGFGADPGDEPLLRLLEAQTQGGASSAGRNLAAETLATIPSGVDHAALRAYASLVVASLAFEAGALEVATNELASGRASASSGLLAARASLLQARVAFARNDAGGEAGRDLARAIDRLSLLGAPRDLGLAYLVRATSASDDASERKAWFAKAQPLLLNAGRPSDLERLRASSRHAARTLGGLPFASGHAVVKDLQERRERLEAVVVEHCEGAGQGPCNARHGCAGYEAIDDVLATVSDAEEQLVLALQHSLIDRTRVGQLAAATQEIASIAELHDLLAAIPRLALVVCPATAAELLQFERQGGIRVLSRCGVAVQASPAAIEADLCSAFGGRSAAEAEACPFAVFPLVQTGAGEGAALLVEREGPAGPLSIHDLEQLTIYASLAGSALARARATTALRERAARDAATLSAIRDGVVALDSDGIVVSANEAAASALAVRRQDLLGHRLTEFPSLVPLCVFLAESSGPGTGTVALPQGEAMVRYLVHEGGAVLTVREPPDRALARRAVGAVPRFTFEQLVGRHPSFLEVLNDARKAAGSDVPVVISGDSGTGKELLAQAMHNASPRAGAPFLAINVTAIPRELLESELFGYEGGAFTGARSGGMQGKFELAGRGTLVLDEIGDMPLEMQSKLLRVLQEMTIQRLGSAKDIPVRARVIATTHRDLEQAVTEGKFRLDLYYRLRVVHLRLPPLRDRKGDVRALVEERLLEHARKTGRKVSIAPEVMAAFERYDWPGNVRELVNVVEGELSLLPPGSDVLSRVPASLSRPLAGAGRFRSPPAEVLPLVELERRACEGALLRFGGNVAYAARALGVARGTLYAKMKRYGIPIPETNPGRATAPASDPPT